MDRQRYRSVIVVAAVLVLVAAGVPAMGAAFPTRSIEFVVPFGAGGGSDILARAIARAMADERILPVPLVVVNRPGGGGAVGWGHVLGRRGDPYVLSTVSGSLWTTPLAGRAPFTYRDFTPVAGLVRDTFLLAVRSDSAYRTIRDIVVVSRRSPELISVGGSAAFSDDKVATGLFQEAAGIRLNFIPFGGTGPALTAMLGGHISSVWLNPAEGLEQIRAGRVRALAVTSPSRLDVLPDVPTFRELGYDIVWEMFRGVIMAPEVPAAARRHMGDAFLRMCRSARWQRDYVEPNILLPACQGPDEFARTLTTVNERYVRVLRALGLIR